MNSLAEKQIKYGMASVLIVNIRFQKCPMLHNITVIEIGRKQKVFQEFVNPRIQWTSWSAFLNPSCQASGNEHMNLWSCNKIKSWSVAEWNVSFQFQLPQRCTTNSIDLETIWNLELLGTEEKISRKIISFKCGLLLSGYEIYGLNILSASVWLVKSVKYILKVCMR